MASRTTDGRGPVLEPLPGERPRGRAASGFRCRPVAQRVLAVSFASFMVLTAIVLESRPVAAVSGRLEVAYAGLDWPVAFTFAPDGRLFFVERYTGNIRIIEGGSVLPTPFYTIGGIVSQDDDGLLGLALHPSFSTQPWVYAYYTFNDTANQTVYNRIVRIWASGDLGTSFEVVLDRIPAAGIHVGGVIAFGLDGKLYAAVGDNFNRYTSQNLSTLAGKVLRMDPDGSVPPDNPFVGNASVNPYVYVYGVRNPFGIAFHPITGRVFITENGPECNDEVDLLIPGRNYGWGPKAVCSSPPTPPNNTNQDGPDPVLPLTWYATTFAPTNAIIYNGSSFPAWRGDLFFGNWMRGELRRLHLAPPNYDTVVSDDVILVEPEFHCCIIDVEVGPDGSIWFSTAFKLYRYSDTSLPPIASFTVNPSTALVGASVTFNAFASTDPDGTIVSYAWDFGDNRTGTGMITSHPYATEGTYNVTLTVTDNDTLKGTARRTVTIQPAPGPRPPTADFVATPSLTTPGASVTFDGAVSSDSDGTIVSYVWQFGDSLVGNGVTVNHAYANSGLYTATLTVVDNQNLSSTAAHQVMVATPPDAAFTFSPATAYIGLSVTFDGSTSTDQSASIRSYTWDFGDSSTGAGFRVAHSYGAKGTYVVRLVVTDDLGATDEAIQSVVIGNRAPSIATTSPAYESTVNVSETKNFTVVAEDLDGDLLTFSWSVDGVPVAGSSPSYAFVGQEAGFHVVVVVVSDGSAAVAFGWAVEVREQSVPPGPSSSFPSVAIVATGLGMTGLVALAALLLRRRRRG